MGTAYKAGGGVNSVFFWIGAALFGAIAFAGFENKSGGS